MVQRLPAHQRLHHRQPFAAIGVTFVVFGEADAGFLQLRPVPGVDQIDRETAAADMLDAERHLRQHDRMIQVRFDRGDDLDPLVSAARAADAVHASN